MNDKKFFYVLLIASVALALVFAVLIFGKGGAQPTGQDEVYQYASLANEHYSNEEWNKTIAH
ncbi:MAG: hypothetical protein U5L75_03400 [Candidatus Campbellbacteria bacterium]|nr:hypothetical protein [Candidatus Campbellbacteria bacterium]